MRKLTYYDLKLSGGVHYSEARSWLQQNVAQGDNLTWGSEDKVHLTVRQVEEIACYVAAAVLNNLDGYKHSETGNFKEIYCKNS